MANHCWNWVGFEGDKATLEKLHRDIKDGLNQSDGYLTKLANYLFNENNTDEDILSLYDAYGTKWWDIDLNDLDGELLAVGGSSAWSPPTEFVRRITEKYKLKAVIEFEEGGCDFGGTETYIDGEIVEQTTMSYNEWTYFNDNSYAIERMIEDINDSPLDYFEDLESLEKELHYMSDADRNTIKEAYLNCINNNQ